MNVDPSSHAPVKDVIVPMLSAYHERIWFLMSRRIELYANRLHLTGNVRSMKIEATVPVASLVLPPDRVWLRSRHFIWATWLLWMLFAILVLAYLTLEAPLPILAGFAALASIPLLPYLIFNAKQIEFFQYKNASGLVVFDICRRGPSAAEFDAFNAAIAGAINDAANNASSRSRNATVVDN